MKLSQKITDFIDKHLKGRGIDVTVREAEILATEARELESKLDSALKDKKAAPAFVSRECPVEAKINDLDVQIKPNDRAMWPWRAK